MNDKREPGLGFERDLGDRLRLLVAERGARLDAEEAESARMSTARRLAPTLAIGGAVAAVAAAAVLAVSAGGNGTPAAYAVETQPGGGTLIKVNALEDAAGLEAVLAEAGIKSQVDWLAPGMACREPHFTPAAGGLAPLFEHWNATAETLTPAAPAGAVTVALGLTGAEVEDSATNPVVISFVPSEFGPEQTLVMYGSRVGEGALTNVQIAEGAVGPCEAVPVPTLSTGPAPSPTAGG